MVIRRCKIWRIGWKSSQPNLAILSLIIFATYGLALSCLKMAFLTKLSFVDDFKFIELLQDTSWYLSWHGIHLLVLAYGRPRSEIKTKIDYGL